jgi:hypothetical protein
MTLGPNKIFQANNTHQLKPPTVEERLEWAALRVFDTLRRAGQNRQDASLVTAAVERLREYDAMQAAITVRHSMLAHEWQKQKRRDAERKRRQRRDAGVPSQSTNPEEGSS